MLRLTSVLNRKRSHVSRPIKFKTAQGSAFIRETAGEAFSLLVELCIRHKCDENEKGRPRIYPARRVVYSSKRGSRADAQTPRHCRYVRPRREDWQSSSAGISTQNALGLR